MTNPNEELCEVLSRYFNPSTFKLNSYSQEDLVEWIAEEIVYMMQYEMEKLLQLLYRIDVDERKVKAAFGLSDPKLIAPQIAQLIVERQLQKLITRKQYKS
jgi:hypothetical protein